LPALSCRIPSRKRTVLCAVDDIISLQQGSWPGCRRPDLHEIAVAAVLHLRRLLAQSRAMNADTMPARACIDGVVPNVGIRATRQLEVSGRQFERGLGDVIPLARRGRGLA